MRPARRGGGVGALVLLLLLAAATTIGYGCRGAEAIRVVPPHGPAPGSARSIHGHGHRGSHGGGRVGVVDAAMPVVGTRPVPAWPPAADEESKRRIPSCPDPLHNR
uniref:Uncharacterized protein n=1 Tax=Oryza brachyantha TaxID=4533 RepID=J3L0D7_ORYBR